MSGDFQQIVFTGNVEKVGEHIRKEDGFQVLTIRVVSSRDKGDRTINNVFDVRIYGELANIYFNALAPGCSVLIAGRIGTRPCTIEGDTQIVNIDAFAVRVLSVA